MKKLLLIGLLMLGGCAQLTTAYDTLTGVNVTPKQVYIVANAFNAVQGTATQYLNLPLCTGANGPFCRTADASVKVKAIILSSRPIRDNLEAAVTNGDMTQSTPLYQVLGQNITQINTLIAGAVK